MPLKSGSSPATVSTNIKELHTGKTFAHTAEKFGKERADKQAVAIALSNARKGRAFGGVAPLESIQGNATHLTRAENRPYGLIHSSIPGRTDRIPLNVAPHSYVIPSDVVSGIGQGNTLAGAKLLHSALPNMASPKMQHFHSTIPKVPHIGGGLAKGGPAEGKGDTVPVITAGGEFIVHPAQVFLIGFGDLKEGHKKLDAMVKSVRKQVIARTKKLPGPVK